MNDLLNKKYNIELEVLTPLHVGAGQEKDWVKGADYISDKGKVYILNHKKVAQKLSANELAGFLLSKDDYGLKKKIAGDLSEVSDLVFKAHVESNEDINTFVKNGLTNKPIVPGSSVKGAIRSILLSYFIDNRKSIDKRNRRFEEDIFGSANKGDEFMRFIKITDAQFEKTDLVNTKIFNLFGENPKSFEGGWKHKGGRHGETNSKFKPTGFNTSYEVLNPGESGELSISLSDVALDNLIKNDYKREYKISDKKKGIINTDISEKLFCIINKHTKLYIGKQIAFFEKYPNNETHSIISSLTLVLNSIPDDNSSCVLKMSAGSGFHSITGDWQFDDFSIDGVTNGKGPSRGQLNRNDSAKSRKIAVGDNKFELMGFVKLTVLSDELIAQREAERKAKREAELKVEQERIEKDKAEKEKLETEKLEKEEAERKAKEERLAKEKAEKDERDRIIKQSEEEEKLAIEKNKEKKAKLESAGLIFLSDVESYSKGKVIIRDYKKLKGGIDEDQYQYIIDFIIRCISVDKPNLWSNIKRGNWKDIVGFVGKQAAQQWFNEITKK